MVVNVEGVYQGIAFMGIEGLAQGELIDYQSALIVLQKSDSNIAGVGNTYRGSLCSESHDAYCQTKNQFFHGYNGVNDNGAMLTALGKPQVSADGVHHDAGTYVEGFVSGVTHVGNHHTIGRTVKAVGGG